MEYIDKSPFSYVKKADFSINEKKAGLLRLPQVCVRKHIPRLVTILYICSTKYARIIYNFLKGSYVQINQDG